MNFPELENFVRELAEAFPKVNMFPIFQGITNFMKVCDKQRLINGEYPECILDPELTRIPAMHWDNESMLKLEGYPYKIYVSRLLPPSMESFLHHPDILAGIYCPKALPGQNIKIQINRSIISEITITDPTKIILPIENSQMILTSLLNLSKIKIESNAPNEVLLINVKLNEMIGTYLRLHYHAFWIPNKRKYMIYRAGLGYLSNEVDSSIKRNYHLAYQVNKFKRPWRRFCKVKGHYKQIWKRICEEIRAYPGRGIDYFSAEERFKAMQ